MHLCVNWGHAFTDVICNSNRNLLPSLWFSAIWCAAGKSLLQCLSLGFVLSTQLYFCGSHPWLSPYCLTWFLCRWWKRLVVFDQSAAGRYGLHICNRLFILKPHCVFAGRSRSPVWNDLILCHVHFPVCLCCLCANPVCSHVVLRNAKRCPHDSHKECELRHNGKNNRAHYETIDVFLPSHNIYILHSLT